MPVTRSTAHQLEALRTKVRAMFGHDVVAHDFAHLERVERNAARLLEIETGDPFVVGAACLLHDLHRILERDLGHHVAPERADAQVRAILDGQGVDTPTIDHVFMFGGRLLRLPTQGRLLIADTFPGLQAPTLCIPHARKNLGVGLLHEPLRQAELTVSALVNHD